ncbi:hypothetical protein [Thioflexithrix psekupsensis]|uniref:Uncharacterized protein n=1 Tax=Thioflexithrix psekupsensis TaxID=1570016 RepID=A0A251X7W3_9GAMM|nr:hypothetical protein [Thioflexithrix psekupsensis]OUD14139.1 hypothetical protein TPSD3_07335 [Thioflexithrix psekupsensis]
MSVETTLKNLEIRARRIIGVPCVAIIDNNRVEVISSVFSGFIRLEYRKNGEVVSRSSLLT